MSSMFRRDATAVEEEPLLCLPEDASWTDNLMQGMGEIGAQLNRVKRRCIWLKEWRLWQ